ncbi:MAG TPA: methyltransferase domain-containing protein [Geobacteraceae bacterium]
MTGRHDETIDELRHWHLRLVQKRSGYRFSLDPLLLCDFATVGEGARVIDLGTGSGIIPLVLARKSESATFVGLERQEEMAELAWRNAALNGLDARVSIVTGDVADVRKMFPVSSFDLVVANPPYRRRGTGRVSPRAGRDTARHESTATLADFLAAAKFLVRPAGTICFIYHPLRLPELFAEAALLKLSILRLRMVHGSETAEARMFLVEMAKGRRGELQVLPPLFVNGGGPSGDPRGDADDGSERNFREMKGNLNAKR